MLIDDINLCLFTGIPVITTSLNGDPQERVQFYVVGCESEKGKGRGKLFYTLYI